jgi:hypothetical protein
MGYSEAGGKLIDEKNQKQKISWHCPFNHHPYKVTIPPQHLSLVLIWGYFSSDYLAFASTACQDGMKISTYMRWEQDGSMITERKRLWALQLTVKNRGEIEQ